MNIVTAECSVCYAKQTRLREELLSLIFCSHCKVGRHFSEVLYTPLRDQFAMAALPGLIPIHDATRFDLVSRDAYALADCMLKARNEKTENR